MFFKEYLQLDEAERSAVSEFLRKVCKPAEESTADLSSLSIDEKVQLYRQELEREEKAAERSEALQENA
ncbi:MAG: hypothetical protein LUE65_07160 [Clostridiales bacterium]|nr:hypothetical protein [Clostridiales bacterium]